MKYKVFWCKVNKYYTDKWLSSNYFDSKSGIFLATCVVTDQAKRRWIKYIKDIFKNMDLNIELGEKLFISWCWAFKDWVAQEEFFDLYPELLQYKNYIEILWENPELHNTKNDKTIFTIKEKLKTLPQLYTKKFVLIQWGCDSFCTFCLTVQKRWRHFFRSKEDIRDEILYFEKSWWKEVVLTWVNLSAWGLNSTNDIWKSKFAELLEYLLDNTSIPRLRISSMWPEFINDTCLKIFENKRIYPHFHYSIQSWSSNILKSMARHYDSQYMRKILEKTRNIKRQDNVQISIWADMIVWFPWETEDDFKQSLDLISDYNITKLHAFPFSAHTMAESVPAWFFKDQVDNEIKKERMFQIMSLGDSIRDKFINDNIWKTFEVLIETVKDDKWKGWTQNYIEVDSDNFLIISWIIWKNEIVNWILKK